MSVGDIGRNVVVMPRRIIQRLGVVEQRLVIDEPFDRWTPEERTEAHLRCALMQRFQNVVGIPRRGRETGVLEAIHADGQSAPNLFRPVRMRDDWKFARVRFVDDRLHFFHRHLVLIDQLDDVDSGVGEFFTFACRRLRL